MRNARRSTIDYNAETIGDYNAGLRYNNAIGLVQIWRTKPAKRKCMCVCNAAHTEKREGKNN